VYKADKIYAETAKQNGHD